MRGEVLIEVYDNNNNLKRTVKKKNRIANYYKKYPFVVQHLKALWIGIPKAGWSFPLVLESGFSFNESTNFYYKPTSELVKLETIIEEDVWNSEGQREIDFVTDGYFEGPVEIKGIVNIVGYSAATGSDRLFTHCFSALDLEPYIIVEETERVYIHYKLLLEW
jgi:hypothetical protein